MDEEIQDYGLDVLNDDEIELAEPKNDNDQVRRWFLTINNPMWNIETDKEFEYTPETNIEIIHDLSVLEKKENACFFEYKIIKHKIFNKRTKEYEFTGKIIKRPYFKSYDDVKKFLQRMYDDGLIRYAVGQYEQGVNETPHIHIALTYSNTKRFINVKQDFPTARIEKPKSTNKDCKVYCTKEKTRIAEPFEIGVFVEERERTDIKEFHDAIDNGATNAQLKALDLNLYARYTPEKIERFRQDNLKEKYAFCERDVKITFVYGAPRTGKSTFVTRDLCKGDWKNICRVSNYKVGTFENYQAQDVIIFDEFASQIPLTFMNDLLDRFPLPLPARFANRQACYTRVYIISNYALKDLYKDDQMMLGDSYKAFVARIDEVIYFYDKYRWRYEKSTVKQMEMITDPETLAKVETVFEKRCPDEH